jgi:CheY-like chemotaxis protein
MAQTVMVIDDHAISREGIKVILTRHGYDVITAENGRVALERLMTGTKPDVILLDMLMPALDGWRLLERLKGTPAGNIPVIITTGTILTREWAEAQKCAGFLKKPIEEQDLLEELRAVLPPTNADGLARTLVRDQEWAPDSAFALVQAGLMVGKSIGLLRLKSHPPTAEEIRRRLDLASVGRIIDEWLLVEYCCRWLPANPEAVTEQVSKAVAPGFARAIGLTLPPPQPAPDLHGQLATLLSALDVAAVTAKSIEEGLASYRGRVS